MDCMYMPAERQAVQAFGLEWHTCGLIVHVGIPVVPVSKSGGDCGLSFRPRWCYAAKQLRAAIQRACIDNFGEVWVL